MTTYTGATSHRGHNSLIFRIFLFSEIYLTFAANHRLNMGIPRQQEGRVANVRKRGAGCDGRELRQDVARLSYDEIVWS